MVLPKPTHAVFYSRTEKWSEQAYDRIKPARAKFFASLQSDAKLLYFGPWRDVPGEMSILVGTDEDAARIASADPAVSAGLLSTQVQAWRVLVEPFTPVRSLDTLDHDR
jgi:uncharacterized protein YciI